MEQPRSARSLTPNYESANGMFGGWTTAVILQAVASSAAGGAEPSVINVIAKIEPDTNLIIRTRRAGGSRAVSHWIADLMSENQTQPLANASVVLAERRFSDEHVDISAPSGPDPETLELVYPAPGSAGERCAMRPIEGFPPFGRATTYSTAWVKEVSGRSVDHLQLAFLPISVLLGPSTGARIPVRAQHSHSLCTSTPPKMSSQKWVTTTSLARRSVLGAYVPPPKSTFVCGVVAELLLSSSVQMAWYR
jgi:Thioesterase-like superfamily